MNRLTYIAGLASLAGLLVMTQAATDDTRLAVSHLPQEDNPADDYYDIGSIHRPVSTDSEQAQIWFDRGLAMCFAFNHEEGVRCFQKALQADASLAMAYWGLAYALGPNINNMEIDVQQMAQAGFALKLAALQASACTPVEQDLIATLAKRHPTPIPAIDQRDASNREYAAALRSLYQRYPDDAMVATLFAESLMNLQPWMHWDKQGQPGSETLEIVRVLESSLQRWPDHPALCHLYIHTMEASPTPQKALPAANRLRDAMPGAGHMVHMPTHIDVVLGDYETVIQTNLRAIEADKVFLEREGNLNFFTLYRVHNYHFVVYGAMFDGQSQVAMQAARELTAQIPEELLRGQTDFVDAFMPMPLHVMIRFGHWQDILAEPQPQDYLPMSQAVWHYARALAYAATDRVGEARAEQLAFLKAKAAVPETSLLFNNTSRDILGVAEAMVAGEIEYRQQNFEMAFKHLREAVALDDALNYDEPWGWMQPARHALGALLLEQGHAEQAETVYREDLRRRPHNPWSLQGLEDCLRCQEKIVEADEVHTRFLAATQRADIQIDRSCFCKTGNQED